MRNSIGPASRVLPLIFRLPESKREADVIEREQKAEREIRDFIEQRNIDICAIIIEPIQGEGGDNHFRGEWLQKLRTISDENDILLIFDEVQCGMGATGRNWCCEHFDVVPDLMAFGKKAQVCGVMAGPRIDEVKDNAFRLPSRLNSTWGGNFTDMVRSTHYLRIIEQERLVENAAKVGAYFLDQLRDLQTEEPLISAARGRGVFLAFDLPDAKTREEFWHGFFDLGVLTLRSGENSIRFRPALDITAEVIDEAMELMRKFAGANELEMNVTRSSWSAGLRAGEATLANFCSAAFGSILQVRRRAPKQHAMRPMLRPVAYENTSGKTGSHRRQRRRFRWRMARRRRDD